MKKTEFIQSIRNNIPSLSTNSDAELEKIVEAAKRKTLVLRSVLKLVIIFISGCLYLLAKAYLLDKGYSQFTSIIGSIFIIASAFFLVDIIDEKILLASIKNDL